MLLGFFTGASLFLAGFLWARLDLAFWSIPLIFLGSWLAMLLAAFVFLCVVCAFVDIRKPQHEDSPFYRKLAGIYAEGLIDVLIPTPRWRTCDYDIPVGLWKRLLAGTDTVLAPGIEILLQPGQCRRFYATKDQVMGLAGQHFALGGDKTYLFNYFDDPRPEDTYWNSAVSHPDAGVLKAHQDVLLRTIGDPELTKAQPRSHVITSRDMMPEWRADQKTLPFTCNAGKYKQIRLCAGRIPQDAKVTLKLGVAGGRGEGLIIKKGEIVKKLPEDQLLAALKEELDNWSN